MVSWQVPYLSKGRRPDFVDGLGGDSNNGPVLSPGVYFSPTRIMAPLSHHFVSDEVYICSGLLFMISWWLPYLAKGPCLISIMAQQMT